MIDDRIRDGQKSLAQVLYEASPMVGWNGPWSALHADQVAWWQEYAEIARLHVNLELEHRVPLPLMGS